MANEHYKNGSVETRELIQKVHDYCDWMTPSEIIDSFNIIKYAQRAGLKEGEPWEKDARKIADYFTHFRFGRYIDQAENKNRNKITESDLEEFSEFARRNHLDIVFKTPDGSGLCGVYAAAGSCEFPIEEVLGWIRK